MAKKKKNRKKVASRPLGDPPGRVCMPQELVVGQPNPKVQGTGYNSVCLTENQAKHLFGKSKRASDAIGAGSFAVAWLRQDGDVVKITSDPTDVTSLLKAQGRGVVKVKQAFRLAKAGRRIMLHELPRDGKIPGAAYGQEKEVYGLVTERLVPIPNADKAVWMSGTNREWLMSEDAMYEGPREKFKVSPAYREDVNIQCSDVFQGNDAKAARCALYGQKTADLFETLVRRGISWSDIHYGNVGFTADGEQYKVLDLGLTESAVDQEGKVPVINGFGGALRRLFKLRRRVKQRLRRRR